MAHTTRGIIGKTLYTQHQKEDNLLVTIFLRLLEDDYSLCPRIHSVVDEQ